MHDLDGLALHETLQQLEGEIVRPGMKVDRDGLVPQRLHMGQGRVGPHHDGLRDEAGRSVTMRPPGTGLGAAHLPPLTGIEGGRRLRFEGRILPEGGHLARIGFQQAVHLPGVCGRNTTSRPSWANNPASWATSHGRSKTA